MHSPVHVSLCTANAAPYRPAGQRAVHPAVVSPAVLPYVPGGHNVHNADPRKEYDPAGHRTAVELVDPAGQEYPAEQLPLHAAEDTAPTAP